MGVREIVRVSLRRALVLIVRRIGPRSVGVLVVAARRAGAERRVNSAVIRTEMPQLRSASPNRAVAVCHTVLSHVRHTPDERVRILSLIGNTTVPTGRAIGQEQYAEIIKQRLDAHDVGAAHVIAQEGVFDHPDSQLLNDHLVATADHLGEIGSATRLAITGAQRHIRQLTAARQPIRPESRGRLGPDGRICLTGFYYSGSSAVVDFLQGLQGVAKWTPVSEMQLIRYPGGLGDLAERFAAQGSLGPQDIVDFYLHLVGTKVTLTPQGEYDTWRMVNRGSRRLQASNRATGYLNECFSYFLRFAESGERDDLSADRLESSFRDFVANALDAAAGDLRATTLLIDQAAVAARIDLARFLPPSKFVIVFRDPRDQFAEAREARKRKGRPPISVQAFAEVYRNRRRLVQSEIPKLEGTPGHQFLHVSFEAFVLDHDKESTRVLDFLELGDRERIAHNFRPEVSRANVGKFRQLIDADESALLCAALPEFLSEHVQDRTSSTRSATR